VGELLAVALGGMLGASGRYLVTAALQRSAAALAFPLGTLAVNALGCLLIGAAFTHFETRGGPPNAWRLFLIAGVLGGFTTFSAFGLDTWLLWRDAGAARALLNVAAQLGVGLLALLLGVVAARMV